MSFASTLLGRSLAGVPRGWAAVGGYLVGAVLTWGVGWLTDRPLFHRRRWLWAPLLMGLLVCAVGIIFAAVVVDMGGWVMYSAASGRVEAVKDYLYDDPKPTVAQKSALLRRVIADRGPERRLGSGQAQVALLLVQNGANVNAPLDRNAAEDGVTLFHKLCAIGSEELVRTSVEHGAKLNEKTQLDYTPLNFAITRSPPNQDIVVYLLERGAKAGAVSKLHVRNHVKRRFPQLAPRILGEQEGDSGDS